MNFDVSNSMKPKTSKFDVVAAFFSTLCILHCIALPTLAVFMPFFGLFAENPTVHKLFALGTVGATALVWLGCKPVGRVTALTMAVVALAVVAIAFLPVGETTERLGTVAAAGTLVVIHLIRILKISRAA